MSIQKQVITIVVPSGASLPLTFTSSGNVTGKIVSLSWGGVIEDSHDDVVGDPTITVKLATQGDTMWTEALSAPKMIYPSRLVQKSDGTDTTQYDSFVAHEEKIEVTLSGSVTFNGDVTDTLTIIYETPTA